jgi:hypothetical protein
MKKLLTILLLFAALSSQAQDSLLKKYVKPNGTYGWILNRLYTPYALTPALDTLDDAPMGSIAFKNHIMYFRDTTWKMWTGGGGGNDGNNYPLAIAFTNNLLTITRNGTTAISGAWDSTKYHSMPFYDTRYALAVHSHVAADISDFTTASRNLFSAGTGLSYNNATGVFSWTGSSSGITSFNGLSGTTQTIVTGTTGTDFNIASAGTAHTFNLPKAALNVTGKLDSADWRHFDSSYQVIKTGAAGGVPSLTQYRLAIGNASNQLSTASAITGSRVLVSDANGVPVHSTVTTTTLGYLDVTSSAQTQINSKEATFTETTQEFTSSTSMSITLSNTPKSGKAEMYYLNGIVIKQSNISRTGTGVTLSGFTRESSDVITAKYSY